jgi:hypothetical protein
MNQKVKLGYNYGLCDKDHGLYGRHDNRKVWLTSLGSSVLRVSHDTLTHRQAGLLDTDSDESNGCQRISVG